MPQWPPIITSASCCASWPINYCYHPVSTFLQISTPTPKSILPAASALSRSALHLTCSYSASSHQSQVHNEPSSHSLVSFCPSAKLWILQLLPYSPCPCQAQQKRFVLPFLTIHHLQPKHLVASAGLPTTIPTRISIPSKSCFHFQSLYRAQWPQPCFVLPPSHITDTPTTATKATFILGPANKDCLAFSIHPSFATEPSCCVRRTTNYHLYQHSSKILPPKSQLILCPAATTLLLSALHLTCRYSNYYHKSHVHTRPSEHSLV